MPNYQQSKIYTIRCHNDPSHIYVGSTTQILSQRWAGHKRTSLINKSIRLYQTINNEWQNWYIELYEHYPCDNKEQLCKREGEVIREISTLNKKIEGRTRKEWYNDNLDKNKEYRRLYQQQNADAIKAKTKQYKQQNADVIKEKQREYYQQNADIIKAKTKQYQQRNANAIKEKQREYYQQNADIIKAKTREYYQRKKLEKQQKTTE